MEEKALEPNRHSHKLTRLNLYTCSACGKFVATTYRETKNGELLIEELEFELKVVSSRISRLHSTATRNYADLVHPPDAVTTA